VRYEDLAGGYAETIIRVLNWLGVAADGMVDVSPPRLHRRSHPRKDEWLRRYLGFKSTPDGGLPPAPASEGAHGPLSEHFATLIDTVSPAWKRWIGQSVIGNAKDEDVVSVLVRNGYSESSATSEVAQARLDPYVTVSRVSITTFLTSMTRSRGRDNTGDRARRPVTDRYSYAGYRRRS
jgi:hypothetical protein